MDAKKSRGKYTLAIIIVAVLLIISATLLAIVLLDPNGDDPVSPNNIIGKDAQAEPYINSNLLFINPTPVISLADVSSSGSDKITLAWWTGYDGDKTFKVSNMLPGDVESKEYKISVKTAKGKSVAFETEITSNSLLSEILNIKIEAEGKTLYDGIIADMTEVSCGLTEGVSSQELNYKITVSLPTSADNDYAGLSLKVKFIWTLSEEEATEPPDTDPVTPPDTDPVTPPDTDPVTPPDTDPVTPPDTEPVTPPDTEPVTPPDTDPVTPPDTDPVTPPDTDPVTPPDTDSGTEPIDPPDTKPVEPPAEPEKCDKCFIEAFWEDLFGEKGDRCPICQFALGLVGADAAACICPWGCLAVVIGAIVLIVVCVWGAFKLINVINKKKNGQKK